MNNINKRNGDFVFTNTNNFKMNALINKKQVLWIGNVSLSKAINNIVSAIRNAFWGDCCKLRRGDNKKWLPGEK
ncbi:TPA: hypothetical protein N7K53_003027 [Escherichia coli]|nr:hypothetical protein [Escherichia coli]HCO2797183.1 hypothetical protein [Escherichia coli]